MRVLWAIILVTFSAIVAGAIGYQVGVSQAIATSTAAAGGTVVYHAAWGFGFPWLGFLFFPFFLFLLFGLFAVAFGGRRRWGGGPGWGYGPGGYGGGSFTSNPDDPRYRWVADAHRRLHDDEAAGRTPTPPAPPSAG